MLVSMAGPDPWCAELTSRKLACLGPKSPDHSDIVEKIGGVHSS